MTFKKFSGILNEFRPDLKTKKTTTDVQIIYPDGYIEEYEPKYFKILNKMGIKVCTEKDIMEELDYINNLDPGEYKELYNYHKERYKDYINNYYII